ncbi:hypothetical protein CC80DRAFT_48505 [Byssothecium circinans]|uniref:Uncharacterized protein n=1 Tax=Byssothecium circinans TaxID=147558 RepID=A0A6A5U110_9PLEO|nr:hypothetical protein CC80DRAFT_48505 [Byssothecium circinans]
MCEKPKPGKCLFYTRHLSATAAKYGRSHGYSTIWDMWDKSLYDNSRAKRNPLRCIMAANKAGDAMRKYFANMSRAMAFQCDGFATVMDKQVSATNKKFNALRKDGIWYTVEFPQLQLGGFGKKVEQIMAMSPDGSNEFTYWSRAGGNAAKRDVLGAAGNQTEADLGVVNPDDIVLPAEVEQAIDDMVDEMRADHGDAAEKRELTKRTKSPLARCVNGKGSPGAAKDAEGIAW